MEKYIEKSKCEDVVIRLTRDHNVNFLVHYAAPFTGSDYIKMEAGATFRLRQHMSDSCIYMSIEKGIENIIEDTVARINKREGPLKGRCRGISFYVEMSEIVNGVYEVLEGSAEGIHGDMAECENGIYLVKGGIFNQFLCLDGISVIIPSGLTEFRFTAFRHFEKKSKQQVCYNPNAGNRTYTQEEAKQMIFDSLDSLYLRGCKRIGLNSVKTDQGGRSSDAWTIYCVMEWVYKRHIPQNTLKLFLVDARTGFLGYAHENANQMFHEKHGFYFSRMYERWAPFADLNN